MDYRAIFTIVTVMVLVCGCQENREKVDPHQAVLEQEHYQPFTQASAIAAKQVTLPDYRLNVGDMLEIIYHVKHLTIPNYRFHTEDTIAIRFAYHPKFDQTVTIPADGRVRLLLIGEVDTYSDTGETQPDGRAVRVGKKVNVLETELQDRYGRYFRDPDLTVTFKAANKKIEELKRAITTAPRGQSRLMPIKPDGNITLPFILDIRAYGKTIVELHRDLNDAYKEAGIPELEVTVQILTVAPRKIFVMGEVTRPGVVEVDNMITLTHVLAMAGGVSTRGDRRQVLVVRRKGLPIPQGTVVDVDSILNSRVTVGENGQVRADSKAWLKDLWLDDYDLVYVPTTAMAKRNDWIDQVFTRGIWSVMPFSTSVGVGFGYQMHNAPYTGKMSDQSRWNNITSSVWGD